MFGPWSNCESPHPDGPHLNNFLLQGDCGAEWNSEEVGVSSCSHPIRNRGPHSEVGEDDRGEREIDVEGVEWNCWRKETNLTKTNGTTSCWMQKTRNHQKIRRFVVRFPLYKNKIRIVSLLFYFFVLYLSFEMTIIYKKPMAQKAKEETSGLDLGWPKKLPNTKYTKMLRCQ